MTTNAAFLALPNDAIFTFIGVGATTQMYKKLSDAKYCRIRCFEERYHLETELISPTQLLKHGTGG